MRHETHWPTFAFYFFFLLIYLSYKTDTLQNMSRWVAGLYSGDPAFLSVVGHPFRHQWLAHFLSPYTYLFQSRLDFAGWPVTVCLITIFSGGYLFCPLKSLNSIVVALMSTKPGSMPALALPIPNAVPNTGRPASLPFPKVWRSCVTGLQNTTATTSAWNLPASIGSPFSMWGKE